MAWPELDEEVESFFQGSFYQADFGTLVVRAEYFTFPGCKFIAQTQSRT
jgi:hypothetical protein